MSISDFVDVVVAAVVVVVDVVVVVVDVIVDGDHSSS
jgi:hypothetical protein